MRVCAYRKCVTLQQNQVSSPQSPIMDIVLKSGTIISHKNFLMLFLKPHFLFKNRANIPHGALSMTCSQSPWSLHFLLTNTDAHSDLGHQSSSLLLATLCAIRHFFLN